jgi:hypothetical protein
MMQGVIVTPSGDVWILGIEKRQLVYFPNGDLTKGRIVCEGDSAEPCKSFSAPFHLAIDQQDRIWVSNQHFPSLDARAGRTLGDRPADPVCQKCPHPHGRPGRRDSREHQGVGLDDAGETPVTVAHYLGLTPKWVDGTAVGGCSFMIHVRHAAAAIASESVRVLTGH